MNSVLNPRDFQQLRSLIYSELGIKMPESKNTMLTGRLGKRLRALGFASFSQYCNFLFSPKGLEEEMVHLINAVTTNKTDFFREPTHFDYLTSTALGELQQSKRFSSHNPLRVWSAGCSTGEEPYTLAMVLSEVQERNPGFRFQILATDISTRVLQVAKRAVYPMERIEPVSNLHRKKYLLRNKDTRNPEIRIAPELRRLIRFGRLNFMDENFGLPNTVDIIFCRNVIIYFDNETQEKLMRKFSLHLHSGGFLFLGHSESLHGYDTPFVQVAPTIYRKP
ncbi:protein-glutamate O-methyltransferase [Desulfobulbus rhabdoformis]|uniref:CheR family methyltransferase n=1 Tax=Desulfobulbus rhabdoformis TaxID=34032 RepID=UPI001964DBA5|nr:protein-glutamate O-methyltransferase [Desulfobulbus rhabdoformis]MBM9614925.1 protein-glutamate O-methyltransferase [Desulfobulbus rhabdoformis]